jgi:PTS system cellobiose-specific IIB component
MNILLCCAAGMSTSLLVTKMEKAAQEMGVVAKIWAVSADEVKQNLDHADVFCSWVPRFVISCRS